MFDWLSRMTNKIQSLPKTAAEAVHSASVHTALPLSLSLKSLSFSHALADCKTIHLRDFHLPNFQELRSFIGKTLGSHEKQQLIASVKSVVEAIDTGNLFEALKILDNAQPAIDNYGKKTFVTAAAFLRGKIAELGSEPLQAEEHFKVALKNICWSWMHLGETIEASSAVEEIRTFCEIYKLQSLKGVELVQDLRGKNPMLTSLLTIYDMDIQCATAT